jgi:hypothetical protein
LIGIGLSSTLLALAAIVGSACATAAAVSLNLDRGAIQNGLFGFNGSLVALMSATFSPLLGARMDTLRWGPWPADLFFAWLLVAVVGSLMTVPIHESVRKFLGRYFKVFNYYHNDCSLQQSQPSVIFLCLDGFLCPVQLSAQSIAFNTMIVCYLIASYSSPRLPIDHSSIKVCVPSFLLVILFCLIVLARAFIILFLTFSLLLPCAQI